MLRRSLVVRQPARRVLSTAVHASQPGPHQNPPTAVSEAWVASQRAWVDLAVNQPVELSGTDAKGAAWSSRVHVLGVAHNSAANARSVHEVARGVQPDAVALEQDSSDSTLRNRIAKAAQCAPMMKLVNRLMDTPLVSYQQAHGQLSEEEREDWEEGLHSARMGLGDRAGVHHQLGRPMYSDSISAAFMARKLGATFVFIDCQDGRSTLEALKLGEVDSLARKRLREEAFGESLSASFRLWVDSNPGPELGGPLLQFAFNVAMAEAVLPETTPIILTATPKEMREANGQRERVMCRSIIDLCSGKLARKPRKRVLVIVGRNHVASLSKLLKGGVRPCTGCS